MMSMNRDSNAVKILNIKTVILLLGLLVGSFLTIPALAVYKNNVDKTGATASTLGECLLLTEKEFSAGWKAVSVDLATVNTITLSGAFVPKDSTWQNAVAVMYQQCAAKTDEKTSLETYIKNDTQAGTQKSDIEKIVINGKTCMIRKFVKEGKDPWMVVYSDHKKHFVHHVLSAKNDALLEKHKSNLIDLVKNTQYAYFVTSHKDKEDGKKYYEYEKENKEKMHFVLD